MIINKVRMREGEEISHQMLLESTCGGLVAVLPHYDNGEETIYKFDCDYDIIIRKVKKRKRKTLSRLEI